MLVFARKVHNLRHFCFSDLICENAALSHAMVVDVKHDPCRVFARLLKNLSRTCTTNSIGV